MRNLLSVFIVGALLLAVSWYANELVLEANSLLFVGILTGVTLLVSLFCVLKFKQHKSILVQVVCLYTLLLFTPIFSALAEMDIKLHAATATRYYCVFFLAPLILNGSVVQAYRHYFIQTK